MAAKKPSAKPAAKDTISLYELLEVSPRARPEIIKAAYNTLMKEYHPDTTKSESDDRIAKELNRAKEILLDEKSREDYDHDREHLEGRIIGNYRIIKQIAEGGFGRTYYGEHIIAKSPVCIKHGNFVSPQDEEILLKEARSIWDLRHFSIPTMKDIIKLDDNSLALVMSYVPGPTLEQIIKKTHKLEPEHVAWITERSLNALKYLHYHGVVHGDVKPQNIIIQPDTHTIVLVDYGLSIIRPTRGARAMGYTPHFAAPEQMRGDVPLPETDFYGLGMTMIYALGGDVTKKAVPKNTPDSMCDLIKRFIVYDVTKRPSWEKEDLCEAIQDIRLKDFGRRSTEMKPIPGI